MPATFVASCKLPTTFGEFVMHGFEDADTGQEHVALVLGNVADEEVALCRIHSECLTGDCLFSMRCDCGSQLKFAMRAISEHGSGVILYLRQEGRGIGLINKIRAYELQDRGADTVEANEKLGFDADLRDYTVCKSMFLHLQVSKLRLMTNNPVKVQALSKLGLEITERVPIETGQNDHNARYLATKAGKLGHLLGKR
ncbi:MAG: GTP cyclohydrolase II [Gammaproteobacteria bacterium]|nr:GTP cyclohydrolase II [Gammaproteobacteria bacterium]MBT4495045.1 GTP cyclohydrolase II [Gammaproteobacteria bacterium]MBT7372058.1 GTP cyclohydrolase II [Gammaproteobacteria bacterium]